MWELGYRVAPAGNDVSGDNSRPPTARTTDSAHQPQAAAAARGPVPGLLLAWAPASLLADDRAPIASELVVGRGSSVGWSISDHLLSRSHFGLRPSGQRFVLRDLGSRNGTFANGTQLTDLGDLGTDAVVRAGNCVFVLTADLGRLGAPGERAGFDIAGRFHAAPIVAQLRVGARTGRHLLITGETGTGKELAAGALHGLLADSGRRGPLVAYNAAAFGAEQDAAATLLGVSRGAFTGVEARAGALERADTGTLFLDEFHNLPLRLQRALLRFTEDGQFTRLGESVTRRADVRLVLGTNVPLDEALAQGRLAPDLVARLHRVSLPALRERRADIPSIFEAVLRRVLPNLGADVEAVVNALDAPIVERLSIHDYRRGNVRELENLAAVVAARIRGGEKADSALAGALDEALDTPAGAGGGGGDPAIPSAYERHREQILAGWREVEGNLTHLERVLRQRGLRLNRRWLAVFLERWGVRPKA